MRTPPRQRNFCTLLLMLIGGLCGTMDLLQAQSPREYDLKAVLLFNLTRFVEWPPAAFAAPESPLVIGILGQDPYGKVLDDVVRTESYRRHKIQVVRYRTIESVKDCQLLFISAGESGDLSRILAWVRGQPVLTVADYSGFALRGGMIGLNKNADGRIQVSVNLGMAKASGLRISGKLIQVAEVIDSGSN